MTGVSLEPCLVFNRMTKEWSVEDRPPLQMPEDPRFVWSNAEWSDVLAKACVNYRKRGERKFATRQQMPRDKRKFRTMAERLEAKG